MPFWFAPEINYEGVEDIRFAKGWETIDSDGFWKLVFAWDIRLKKKPTILFFEENLKHYFNGLMKVVNENETITIPKTEVLIVEKKLEKGKLNFTGTVKTYDAFTTKKVITLHVKIKVFYCTKTNNYMPLFKMAPKAFYHKTWEDLDKITLKNNTCN
ncbi:hypothetical protein JL193_08745 [Polaribacter batillariae]|uniref:Uncharacterized protein n=1 Tax=Polaribacter batillariae TaxID=2808900 RepID=A0ABX7STT5_9FLAO|nr:hypothetical protein [Polaribacter batillariae]QTD36254.1 hypothetical protein JL193_08745 [Polaribacter batillariae]